MDRYVLTAFLILVGLAPASRRRARSSGSGRRSDDVRQEHPTGRGERRGARAVSAAEQELIDRVLFRITLGQATRPLRLQLEVPAYGAVILRGSVASKEVKATGGGPGAEHDRGDERGGRAGGGEGRESDPGEAGARGRWSRCHRRSWCRPRQV